jgi:hypothetical protein
MWSFHPQSGMIRGLALERWSGILQSWQSILESFVEMNGHPLYPLLAFVQQALKRYRREVINNGKEVERIAWSTGRNPWSRPPRRGYEKNSSQLGDLSVDISLTAFALTDMSTEISLWKSWLQIAIESTGEWPSMILADHRDAFLQRQEEIISAISTTQRQLESILARSIQWQDDAKTVMSVVGVCL